MAKIMVLNMSRCLVGIICLGSILSTTSEALAQNLFTSALGNNSIFEITKNGTQKFATNLFFPTGMAFNKMGDLFVSNGTNILKFTPAGTQTTFVSGLQSPYGLAFDSAGHLFEADLNSSNIYEFTTNGTQSTFASGLKDPLGLAFDRMGNLFVADNGSSNIVKITTNGTQSTFASFSGLTSPAGLAFDNAGNLYVSDINSGKIFKYTTNGVQSPFASGFSALFFMAFDGAGNLFVAQDGAGNIVEIATNGIISTNASGFVFPEGLAFQPLSQLKAVVANKTLVLTVSMPSPYFSTIVQGSMNLINWTNIYTNTPPFTFTDSTTTASRRFYRAMLGP